MPNTLLMRMTLCRLLLQNPHGLPMRHGGSPKFAVKTRQAFFLQTTTVTRMTRRLCQDLIRPRFLARHPYLPLNTAAIKAECETLHGCVTHTLPVLCLFEQFYEREVSLVPHSSTVSFIKFVLTLSFPWFPTGALRVPEGPKKPSPLKPVERKPLESVVRYLGKKKQVT